MRHDPGVDVLTRAPLFHALDPAARRRLIASARCVRLEPRQRLWSHGQPADAIGVIQSGRLMIGLEHAGRHSVMALMGAGEIVGQVGLSLRAAHHFDVTCLRRAQVLLLPNPLIRSLLFTQPSSVAALTFDLANLVVRLTARLNALSGGGVERRLARTICDLVERFGEPFPGGMLIPLKLRRADLASLAATTVESISRQLSRWRASGILIPQPAGYLVTDPRALERLTG